MWRGLQEISLAASSANCSWAWCTPHRAACFHFYAAFALGIDLSLFLVCPWPLCVFVCSPASGVSLSAIPAEPSTLLRLRLRPPLIYSLVTQLHRTTRVSPNACTLPITPYNNLPGQDWVVRHHTRGSGIATPPICHLPSAPHPSHPRQTNSPVACSSLHRHYTRPSIQARKTRIAHCCRPSTLTNSSAASLPASLSIWLRDPSSEQSFHWSRTCYCPHCSMVPYMASLPSSATRRLPPRAKSAFPPF